MHAFVRSHHEWWICMSELTIDTMFLEILLFVQYKLINFLCFMWNKTFTYIMNTEPSIYLRNVVVDIQLLYLSIITFPQECIIAGCGGLLTANHGYLVSPHFPESIPPTYTECSWVIQGSRHTLIRFRWV